MRTIVSLTTYGERVTKTLPKMLDSLHKINGFNPDVVLIYAAETDARNIEPLTDKYPDINVVTVPDIKSFKKYFVLTDSEYDNDNIFITDDDIVFDPDTWVSLVDLHNRHKNETQQYIYAKGCTIRDDKTNTYRVADNDKPYDRFLFWSGCGLFIPPQTMRFDTQTLTDMYEYTINHGFKYVSDDKFMSAYARKHNIKCVCSYTKQHYLDFDGNTKLADMRKGKGKSALHALQSARYFDLPDRDRITVSIRPTRISAQRIESLFDKQTVPPDKIIVNVKPNTKIPDKLQSMPNVEIQHSDNPFTPDTDPNDLVIVFPDDNNTPDDTIENLFTQYYRTNDGYIHAEPIRFVKTRHYGHKPAPNMTRNVFRRKHSDNMPNNPTPEEFAETIIRNTRSPKQLINTR